MAIDIRKLAEELQAERFGDTPPAQPPSQAQHSAFDLAPAMRAEEDSASTANWGRIGANLAGAISGTRQDTSAMDHLQQQGQQRLANEVQLGTSRLAAKKRIEDENPTDPRALVIRSVAERLAPGIEKTPGWGTMGYEKVKGISPEFEKLAEIELKRQAEDAARNKEKGDKDKLTHDRVTDLRKEYSSSPAFKRTQEIAEAFGKIKKAASAPTAAGDLSLIYAYMKLLDPGSSVREGEFANAQNASGLPQKVVSMYNQALNGQRLAPEVRSDFLKQSQGLYDSQVGTMKPLTEYFRDLAQREGLNADDVIVPLGMEPGRPMPTAVAPPMPPQHTPGQPPATTVIGGKRYEQRPDGWYEVP